MDKWWTRSGILTGHGSYAILHSELPPRHTVPWGFLFIASSVVLKQGCWTSDESNILQDTSSSVAGSMTTTDTLLHVWGKMKREAPSEEVRYPLLFHMVDVARVVEALWNRSLQAGTRRFIADQVSLPEAAACAWISFWAGLHDIGKASPVFQGRSEEAKQLLASHGLEFHRFVNDFPHGDITASILPSVIGRALPEAQLTNEFSRAIGMAIGGHHGIFWSKNIEPGPLQRGGPMWSELQWHLAAELAHLLDVASLPTPGYVASRAFYAVVAGLTSVADWIASNEQFFPYKGEKCAPREHLELSHKLAERAIQRVGWADWAPPAATARFQELFPSIVAQPRPLQKKTVELAEMLCGSPGLVMIEAPMGEGKTEAAMYLADRWATTLGQKGCYFALPTQATSNQMFGRVLQFLGDRYPGSPTNLRLIHGGALLSDDFPELRMRLTEDGDSADPSPDVLAAQWFLPKKRGLLAPFGVGTIDQALLSVLQTRHFFVRLFGLAQKTVIIDEIHAYDTYMSTLLEDLIGWLRALGSPVILLSATLPAKKRRDLLQAYGAMGGDVVEASYPRITWASGEFTGAAEVEARREMELHLRCIGDDLEVLAHDLGDLLENGGCVAIVCNTVKRAQEAYVAIREAAIAPPDSLILLHSRYIFEEREKREKRVLQAFGKDGKRPHCAILVATQIIEQSLDVDFDLMVTDLAPVDLVIQRAGRVHRHEHPRPSSMNQPALWIRMPDMDDSGLPDFGASAHIYEPYFLLLSYLNLRECSTLLLPDDIEVVIEKVYGDPKGPWPSPGFENVVRAAKKHMESKVREDLFKARGNLVPKHDTGGVLEFFHEFNKGLDEDNPEVHRSLQALTRLVEPSVQVVCLNRSPHGVFLGEGNRRSLDMSKSPGWETINELLRRSMTITDKRVVFGLMRGEPPLAWKACAALRHHRLLEFENGLLQRDGYLLRLDEELGLCIESTQTGVESEE
jgi:CRISPR-associated endonuclease/helicase Cas3